MNITELKQDWQEWKASRDIAIWPSLIGGFDELLWEADRIQAANAADRITKMQAEIEHLRADLAEANRWRERHSKDAEAYGKQSQANWERAEKAERACAEMRESAVEFRKHALYPGDCDCHEFSREKKMAYLAANKKLEHSLSSTCGQGKEEPSAKLDRHIPDLHHLGNDLEEWAQVRVRKDFIPKSARLVEAYQTEREIIVMGFPSQNDDDESHNCDAMGCGSVGSHVLYRLPITSRQAYISREELRPTVQVLGRCIYNMETSKWPTNEAKQELARLQKLMEGEA